MSLACWFDAPPPKKKNINTHIHTYAALLMLFLICQGYLAYGTEPVPGATQWQGAPVTSATPSNLRPLCIQ